MHLVTLTVENVRQFHRAKFEFQPGFNLLVGVNGAGKTTILRSLHASLGGSRDTKGRTALHDDDIRLGAFSAGIDAAVFMPNGSIRKFQTNKELTEPAARTADRHRPLTLFYNSNEATCDGMRVKRGKNIPYAKNDPTRSSEAFLHAAEMEVLKRQRNKQPAHASPQRSFGDAISVREFAGKILSRFSPDIADFYWRFEPYDCTIVDTKIASKKDELRPEVKKRLRTLALRALHAPWITTRQQPLTWPDRAKVLLQSDLTEDIPRDKDLPILKDIWRSIESLSDSERRLLPTYSLEVKLSPRIAIKRSNGTFSLNQLSDGEQRLFSLFVDIARQLSLKYPERPLGEGEAIILIDEIDVHLHPKWQRIIVPALEDLFPKCQFIATTHSPFVIQATDRNAIISIDREDKPSPSNNGNSIEDIVEHIQGVRIPQRSKRAEELSEAAQHYFSLLKRNNDTPEDVDLDELQAAESAYREASEPFTSDPATHALLKIFEPKDD